MSAIIPIAGGTTRLVVVGGPMYFAILHERLFPELTSAERRALIAIGLVAFCLRMLSGLLKGPEFVDAGYSFYVDIARTFWNGGGFCHAPDLECAVRMPFYPAVIAPFVSNGFAYPWLIVLQSAIGAGVAVSAGLIGALLFNRRVGLLASAVAAINPYGVIHGPSLQDTVLINFLCALAVLLLMLSKRHYAVELGAAAGVALGLTVLTSARMLPVALAACLWVAIERWRDRRVVLAAVAPVVLLIGLWCARNHYVVGSPVLTTEAGLSLWLGNHESTLDVYPNRSIDEVHDGAWQSLDAGTRARIEALASDPVALDRAFAGLAMASFRDRPIEVVLAAVMKVVVSFGGWLSPAQSWPVQVAYAALFMPVSALAVIGLWRARNGGSLHLLVLLVFAAFVVTTAVFWAHTSHRSYVHVFKFIYAASVVEPWLRRRFPDRATPSPVLGVSAVQSAAS